MLPVFMGIAAHRNFLFDARCGAKDFFDKLMGAYNAPIFTIFTIRYAGSALCPILFSCIRRAAYTTGVSSSEVKIKIT